MLENQTISTQKIIDCLEANYNIKIASLNYLSLGADLNASVYKAQAQDNKFYFIKLKRNYNHNISFAITKLLDEAGVQQIILPIKNIHGSQTQYMDNYTLIVYPFIEGEDGFSRKLTNDQWFILGKALRQVHEVEVPATLLSQIRRETYSNRWRQMVKSFFTHDEVKSRQNPIGLKLIKFMKENEAIIKRLIDKADELGEKVKEQSTKFVLCHSDIHGGNVLIDEKSDIYIVDWDEPIMALKERDLMFIGGGVANVWNDPQEEKFFYEGYGVAEVDKMILAYYRHERIVVDIAEFCQELLLAPVSTGDRQIMYKQFTGMFEPQGVVEIAFKTYKGLFA